MLAFRIWGNPTEGWGLIFQPPDPMLGNTITLFVSWAAISILLVNRISQTTFYQSHHIPDGTWSYFRLGLDYFC